MSFWTPHLTRQLPLEIGPQTTTESLSVVPATGATFATTFGGDQNYGVVGANTLRTASQIGNATGAADFNFGAAGAQTLRVAALLGNAAGLLAYDSGASSAQTLRAVLATRHEAVATPLAVTLSSGAAAVDYNAGAPTANTPRVATATAVATFQSAGEIAGTALTGSYATVLTLGADAVCLAILNTCNNTIFVSLDGGTSDTLKLESGESLTLDFGTNGRRVASGVLIQAKHAGAAPTQGTIRVSRLG